MQGATMGFGVNKRLDFEHWYAWDLFKIIYSDFTGLPYYCKAFT